MDLRRIRLAEAVAGIAGATLLASLFLPWFSSGGPSLDGWESLSLIDLMVAIAGLLGLALPVVSATNVKPDLPIATTATAALAGVLASLLVLYRALDPAGDERRAGLFVALAGAALLTGGAWRAMSAES
ncbi:MAG TPA: hypothetical protein VKA89_08130 [Solirubrobacterales bacterium]|nr:hypothetical protein [Solirubrobacterales bacterium]